MGNLVRAVVLVMLFVGSSATAAAQPVPELRFENPDGSTSGMPLAVDRDHLQRIVKLTGLAEPSPPIRVVIVPERSEIAGATPQWIAGVAYGAKSTVLLFPARSPRYPHDTLADVLHHEIAHVLISRAAGGNDIPRWFNEGLASVSERVWNAEDRRQLAWALATGTRIRMAEVDEAFGAGPGRAEAAYALGSAFVRKVIEEHGIEAPATILRGVAAGLPFDRAFERATGVRFDDAERNFSRDVTAWERWIPLVTSPFVLWSAITLLALYALVLFRVRRAGKRRRWEEEEQRTYGPTEVTLPARETFSDEESASGPADDRRD